MNIIVKEKNILLKQESNSEIIQQYEDRDAVRIIIEDSQGRIALVGTKYQLFPGGGVEEGESLEFAAMRESMEEVGCSIDIVKNLGRAVELKDSIRRRQTSVYFYAKIIGEKGIPTTTQKNEQGIKVSWLLPEEVISIFKEESLSIPDKSYHSRFNLYVNKKFLFEYLRFIKKDEKNYFTS